MVVGLGYIQMICCLGEVYEVKYHGILGFYQFASTHNRMTAYL